MTNREDVIRYLTSEAGYAPAEAESAADDLLAATPKIQLAFEWWRDTGRLAPFQVEEFTLEKLVNEYRFHPVAALLTMDWLLTDPPVALAALRSGYDVREAGKQ